MKPETPMAHNEEFLSFELRNKELVLSFQSEDPLSTAWKVLRRLLNQRETGKPGEALAFADRLTLKLDEVIGLPEKSLPSSVCDTVSKPTKA